MHVYNIKFIYTLCVRPIITCEHEALYIEESGATNTMYTHCTALITHILVRRDYTLYLQINIRTIARMRFVYILRAKFTKLSRCI